MKSNIFLVLIFITNMLAIEKSPYILYHDGLIDKRAQDKIKEIGDEAKAKLGINIYIDIKENNGIDPEEDRAIRIQQMRKLESIIRTKAKAPYAILTLAVDQMYANILLSDDLKNIVDKDDILDGYVIPLLASKDKNSLFAKSSAACLNGFAQIADSVAATKDIKLKSSIGNEGKITSTVWKVFMYTLVVTGIVLYIVIIMREKKYKKLGEQDGNKNRS